MHRNTTVRSPRITATVRMPMMTMHANSSATKLLVLTTARTTTRTIIITTTTTRPMSLTSKGPVNVRRWMLTRILLPTICRQTLATSTTTCMAAEKWGSTWGRHAVPMESPSPSMSSWTNGAPSKHPRELSRNSTTVNLFHTLLPPSSTTTASPARSPQTRTIRTTATTKMKMTSQKFVRNSTSSLPRASLSSPLEPLTTPTLTDVTWSSL